MFCTLSLRQVLLWVSLCVTHRDNPLLSFVREGPQRCTPHILTHSLCYPLYSSSSVVPPITHIWACFRIPLSRVLLVSGFRPPSWRLPLYPALPSSPRGLSLNWTELVCIEYLIRIQHTLGVPLLSSLTDSFAFSSSVLRPLAEALGVRGVRLWRIRRQLCIPPTDYLSLLASSIVSSCYSFYMLSTFPAYLHSQALA